MLYRWFVILGISLTACATPTASGPPGRGLLEFEVDPPDATIWVDDAYLGQVNAWMDHTVRLPVGRRRVELRAPGYMTQRFDIEVANDEVVTLRLRMQPTFDEGDVDPSEES